MTVCYAFYCSMVDIRGSGQVGYPNCFLVFFHWWGYCAAALCCLATGSSNYLWTGLGAVYLFAQFVSNSQVKQKRSLTKLATEMDQRLQCSKTMLMALVSSGSIVSCLMRILVIANGFTQRRHVVQAVSLQFHVNPDRD